MQRKYNAAEGDALTKERGIDEPSKSYKTQMVDIKVCLFLALAIRASGFVVPTRSSVPLPTRHRATERLPTARYSFGDLKGIADFFKPREQDPERVEPKFETVVIDPDFRCAGLFLGTGILLDVIPYIQFTLGPLITLLGILFLVQTFRIRFLFDKEALELVTVENGELQTSGENIVVGGANRWKTSSIVNYDFFPKGWIDGPIGPVLIYFKETQTPKKNWNEGPGKLANDPEKVASGEALAGQVHFFPAVCNAQQIREEFKKRGCRKI